MLRSTVLLVLAAALAASSLWLAWGEKSVSYESCRLDLDEGRVCEVRAVHAAYDPGVLRGVEVSFAVVDGEAQEASQRSFRHPYDEPARGESWAAWWHSPVLPWARPLLVSAAVAGPVAAAVGWTLGRREAWTRRASWVPLGSAVLSGAAFLASLGGVALHAMTWTANRVEPLQPVPGTWVLLAAGLAGVAGGLRMHVELRDRAEGRTAASPLVPADALYGFAPEEPEPDETPARREPLVLRWPTGGGFALAATVLLLLPLGLPLATKDITLRDCVDDPQRGAVCSLEPLSVSYHAAHASVVRVGGDASASELLRVGGPHYFGAFQDAHGGPAWMGVGAVVSLLGAAALLAWFVLAAAGAAMPRLRWAGAVLLAAGLVLSVLAVAVQAGSWVGAPAGRSRPAAGLFAGAAGLVVLAAWRFRLHRPASGGSGTATTTSRAG